MASRNRGNSFTGRMVSRRDVLRAGGVMIPAGILLPAWMRANAQTAAPTFDFFISTTGSDSNPGTLSQPWAITALNSKSSQYAGKKVGLVAGTYDVSAANLTPRLFNVPLYSVPSGSSSSPTYISSCDTNGNYSPRAAYLSAKTSGGKYTGSDQSLTNVPNEGGLIGNTNSTCNYITIDGLRFSGVRSTFLAFGQGPGTTYTNNGIIVQNCEFFDSNDTAYGVAGGNYASVQFFNCLGALYHNNYVHNCVAYSSNSSANSGHLSAAMTWCCRGTTFQYNTCVETGGFYGKEGGSQGTIIRYNYVQHQGNPGGEGVVNFTGYAASGMADTTQIYNNIFYTNADGLRLVPNLSYGGGQGWVTPLHIYNNTVYWTSPSVTGFEMFAESGTSAVGGLKLYNNIFAGPAQANEGTTTLNYSAPSVMGYNLYQSATQRWYLTSNATGSPVGVNALSSLSAARSGSQGGGGLSSSLFEQGTVISSQSIQELFAQSGTFAALFKLASGSDATGAGKSNGTSGGTATDIGAWGNGATQIGCNFNSSPPVSTPVPDAPVLTVS